MPSPRVARLGGAGGAGAGATTEGSVAAGAGLDVTGTGGAAGVGANEDAGDEAAGTVAGAATPTEALGLCCASPGMLASVEAQRIETKILRTPTSSRVRPKP